MGCGGSKKKSKVDLNMEQSEVQAVNEMFTSASSPLQTLQHANHKLTKAKKKFIKSTYAHILKDATLADAIHAMLYSFSAELDGELNNLELKPQESKPYVAIKKSALSEASQKIYEEFEDLVEAIEETPEKLEPMMDQIKQLVEQSADYPNKAKDALSDLNPFEAAKVLKIVSNNVQKLANCPKILDETVSQARELSKTLVAIPTIVTDVNLEDVKKIGKEANKVGAKDPKSVVSKFWPDKTRVDLKLDKPKKPKQHK